MSCALGHGRDEAAGRVCLISFSPRGRLAPPVVARQEQLAHFNSSSRRVVHLYIKKEKGESTQKLLGPVWMQPSS
ncbi:unnamed protein product [Urochloa humidicola]